MFIVKKHPKSVEEFHDLIVVRSVHGDSWFLVSRTQSRRQIVVESGNMGVELRAEPFADG